MSGSGAGRGPTGPRVFSAVARHVVRHPWVVIGAWVVLAVVVLVFSPALVRFTNADQSAFLPQSFPSVQAQQVIDRKFPDQAGASGVVVVSRNDGAALTQQDQSKVEALASALSADHIPGVRSVLYTPQLLSANHRVALGRSPSPLLPATPPSTMRCPRSATSPTRSWPTAPSTAA